MVYNVGVYNGLVSKMQLEINMDYYPSKQLYLVYKMFLNEKN
jgi:hypothetical protein